MSEWTDDEFDAAETQAVRDTEREIFADATGAPDADEVELSREMVDDLSQVEGPDGRPVSDIELAESTLRPGAYQWRPIESAELDNAHLREAEANARAAHWEKNFNDYVQEPQRQEQIRQAHERARKMLEDRGVFTFDPADHERLVNDILRDEAEKQGYKAELQRRHEKDVNDSIQAAVDADPSLAKVYDDIVNADPRSARMRGLANDMYNAGERAGDVLASVANDPSIRALRRSDAAPFMPASYRRPGPGPNYAARSRGEVGDEYDQAGGSDRAVNDYIFNSVMED